VKLDDWRLRNGLTYRELGELIGCRVALAFAYCQKPGSRQFKRPKDDRMARIYRATNGAVTPGDFYELPKLGPDPAWEPELPLKPVPAEAA
jgi:hypothetical protein